MKVIRRRTWRSVLATCATAGALLAGASGAHADSYYNIVNTSSGQALQIDSSGKLRVATPNRFALGQQFKLTEVETLGPEWFSASIKNRLGSCLVDNDPLSQIGDIGLLRASNCGSPMKSRRMWSHLRGSLTATPALSGYQLINDQTARYATPPLCLFSCDDFAALWPASFVAGDPSELGAYAKWEYRFAVSAP